MMNGKHTAGKTKAKHNCTSDEQMPLKLGQGMILLKEGLYQEGPRWAAVAENTFVHITNNSPKQ